MTILHKLRSIRIETEQSLSDKHKQIDFTNQNEGQPPRIWCTQDASLVSEAMGIDPQVLLKNLEGASA